MQHIHVDAQAPSVYTVATTPSQTEALPSLDATEQRRLGESIEDYLDWVCRPLMDTLPYAARQELRQEMAQHLNALVQAYRESGYAPALATQKAMDKFGPPHLVARRWHPMASKSGQMRRIERWFVQQWQGMAATLVLCGMAGVLGLVLQASGLISFRRPVSGSQASVTAQTRPAVVAQTGTQTALVDTTGHSEALEKARVDLRMAQIQLVQQRQAFQLAQQSAAQSRTVSGSRLQWRRGAQLQTMVLELQRRQLEQMQGSVKRLERVLTLEELKLEITKKRKVSQGL